MNCVVCGKELIGKQKKYCSIRCTSNYWNKQRRGKVKRYYDHQYESRVRAKVFTHYGGNPPKCAICGFDNLLVLEIDHINNNGYEHRKEEKLRCGRQTYAWLIKNNYPKGYQVLCANCNRIKYLKNRNYDRNFDI